MKFITLLFTIIATSFALHSKDQMEIHMFYINQADSQLIVFPSGYNILIDVGDYSGSEAKHTKHVAKQIEEILGHKTIDVFVCTHYHVDHFGSVGNNGIWYLLEKGGFTVKKFLKRNAGYFAGDKYSDCNKDTLVWKNAGEMNSGMARMVCYASSSKDKTKLSKVAENAHRCSKTQINPPDEGARVVIIERDGLGVNSEDSGMPVGRNTVGNDPCTSENDFSICLRIEYGDFKYATCGDITGFTLDYETNYHNIETYIAPMMGEVDLMKVSHHGADSGTNKKWCETLKPTVSLITCGDDVFPDYEVMDRLKDVGSKMYTTGKNCNTGNIERIGGVTQVGEDIFIAVPTNGSSFTVSKYDGSDAKSYEIKKDKKEPEPCRLLEGEE